MKTLRQTSNWKCSFLLMLLRSFALTCCVWYGPPFHYNYLLRTVFRFGFWHIIERRANEQWAISRVWVNRIKLVVSRSAKHVCCAKQKTARHSFIPLFGMFNFRPDIVQLNDWTWAPLPRSNCYGVYIHTNKWLVLERMINIHIRHIKRSVKKRR